MKDAIRATLANSVNMTSDLDARLERGADRLPPLLLARALVRLDGIAGRLARLRQAVAGALDDRGTGSGRKDVAAGR
jgi:hypothetical protein